MSESQNVVYDYQEEKPAGRKRSIFVASTVGVLGLGIVAASAVGLSGVTTEEFERGKPSHQQSEPFADGGLAPSDQPATGDPAPGQPDAHSSDPGATPPPFVSKSGGEGPGFGGGEEPDSGSNGFGEGDGGHFGEGHGPRPGHPRFDDDEFSPDDSDFEDGESNQESENS